jgi:hypothetical protein
MPIFDRSVSRPSCAEADLLRGVPGLSTPSSPSFPLLLRNDRWQHRRASVTRALIVLALLGLFCGSAVVMSEKTQPSPGAAPVWRAAAAQASVRAHAEVWTTLPASSRLGKVPAAKRLLPDTFISSGAFHARSC